MKILYLITKSNWGGAQKYVYDLASAMRDEDNEVVVACGGYGELYQKLSISNIKVRNIQNLSRNVNIGKEIRVIVRLYKLIKEIKPEVVHLNSSKIGAIGSLVARVCGVKKIIFTAHGWAFREDRNWLSKNIIKFISWLTIILSTKVICVSEKDYRDVKDWLWVREEKLEVIHNGILIQDLRHKTQDIREDTKDSVKISDQPPETSHQKLITIISIGELTKNKGFDYGLRAISLLKDEFKDFKYQILSFGGEEKLNLLKLILDLDLDYYVDLLICNEDHWEYLKGAQIYFLPSIKEGLPYVLLEAGINKLPSVASDTGGVSEIIKNNQTGLLVENKDIYEMKEAILKLIKDQKLRDELGDKAYQNVIKNYSLEKMITETKNIYNG